MIVVYMTLPKTKTKRETKRKHSGFINYHFLHLISWKLFVFIRGLALKTAPLPLCGIALFKALSQSLLHLIHQHYKEILLPLDR